MRTVEEQQDLKQLLKQAALRTVPICSNHQYKKREEASQHTQSATILLYVEILLRFCVLISCWHQTQCQARTVAEAAGVDAG